MDPTIDERDRKILEILQGNSRLSNTEIAKAMGVSEGTIRKRIKRLVDEGIIEKFTTITKKEGQDAIILVRVDTRESGKTIKSLKEKFKEVYEFSGKADLAIRIRCASIDEINVTVDEIRMFSGVRSTETLIRLK